MRGRLKLVAGAAAIIWGCGNGVPPNATAPTGSGNGTPCSTDADCSVGDICVSGTCTQLGIPGVDAGSLGGGDSGNDQMPSDSGQMMMTNYGDFCNACTSTSECGGSANFCLPQTGGGSFCGVECSVNSDCPSNATCQAIGNGQGGIAGHNCYPMGGSCGLPPPDAGQPFDAGQMMHDAGQPFDAGQMMHDAGQPFDAGPPDAGPPDAGACTSMTWANTWKSWFLMTCATGCHHSSSEITQSWAKSSGWGKIEQNQMPPGSPVSSAEKSEIQTWVNCGGP